MNERICSKCKIMKPLTIANFQHVKRCREGFDTICKICHNAAKKVRYHANKKHYIRNRNRWLKKGDNLKKQLLCSKLCHEVGRTNCKIIKEKITKEIPCSICGEHRYGCLEFHHLKPSEKHMEVGKCHSLNQLFGELPKCIVICANCHRLHHKQQLNLPMGLTPIDITSYQQFAATLVYN